MKTFFREKIQLALTWYRPQQEKLKTRWLSLNTREKASLTAGGLVTAILLFYALLWSPLNSQLAQLRQAILSEKKTAAWIQVAKKQLQALESKQLRASVKLLSHRINLVQEDLRKTPLSKHITQLTQNSADEIRCVFDQVDFDTLVTWLIPFSQEHGLTVKQASLRRLNKVGLVQAEFVFRVTL